MRSLFAALAFATLALAAPAQAQAPQGPDLAEQRAAMERLNPLVGRWVGVAQVSFPSALTVHQTERVERQMDGLLLIVHGNGYADEDRADSPIFQAIAIISYDDRRDLYEFRAYTHQGYATTATGQFNEAGAFVWSINPGGPIRIRYTITFDAQNWREIGEMSRDGGATWSQTISMNLRRGFGG